MSQNLKLKRIYMRSICLIIGLMIFLAACNSSEKEEGADDKPSWQKTDTLIIWSTDADNETRQRLFKPDDSIPIPEPLINGIHQTWPEAGVYIKGQRVDTLMIGLKNESWLTDQIGNEGAESFLSFAAMNLLEMKNINHICFDITPGIHAAADTWEDEDFADWKINDQ